MDDNNEAPAQSANDNVFQTHCGSDGFSPQSPDCGQYVVAEPATVVLLLLAAIVAIVARVRMRRRAAQSDAG
jgi:hypothetical protein